jgi:hypothetical protein
MLMVMFGKKIGRKIGKRPGKRRGDYDMRPDK